MEKIISEAKTFEEAYEKLLSNDLKAEDILYTKEEIKGKIFKGSTVIIKAYKKTDLINEVKKYLKEIINNLGLEVSFEVQTKGDRTTIKMYSENNPILIGRNGQTIKSLETLSRQKILIETNINYKISLDVENYKEKKESRLIRLGRNTAKEVVRTKMTVHMDNMTSFERRIVHNALTDFKGIKTHSEGEEPNRHIVITPEKN